jgi:hypothetical protein
VLLLGILRLKTFFNATCRQFQPEGFFYFLCKIKSDVAKKTTMELDSVVVRIVRQVLFSREADGY